MTVRAAIYCRISNDRTGAGLGVARQKVDAGHLAQGLGWEVVGVYTDNDVSAFSGRARPEYDRMLRDVRGGTIDGIIAWHSDRLHRSPVELESFIDVVNRHKTKIRTVQAGELDLSSPSGRMVARQLGSVARYESEHRAERIQRKARELAVRGRIGGGGTRPFGYQSDRRALREDEADQIREGVAWIMNGASLRGVVKHWENHGLSPVTDREWTSTALKRLVQDDSADPTLREEVQRRIEDEHEPLATVREALTRQGEQPAYRVRWTQHVVQSILTSWRIAGWRSHNGEPVAEAEWPPIIDRATLERIRSLLLDPQRKLGHGNSARRYLLSGMVYCSQCNSKLVARPASSDRYPDGSIRRRKPSMVCASGPPFHGCGKIRINAAWLEDTVREAVFQLIERAGVSVSEPLISAESQEVELLEALRNDRSALEELAIDRYKRRVIGDAEFQAARSAIVASIEASQRALERLTGDRVRASLPTGVKAARDGWDKYGLDWRRALVSAYIKKVVVRPGVRGRNRYTAEQLAERIEIQ
jgi:DNA invertase Pin-like site-specific DNA recombinase